MVVGFGVQRDAELDLDVPSGNADFFDQQTEEFLFLFRAEVVDYGGHSAGKSLDSAADLFVAGKFSALRGEVIAAGGEL